MPSCSNKSSDESLLNREIYLFGGICKNTQDAITTPSLRRYELTAWGETQRLFEWARDPRCRTQASTIATRIARGWAPEDAIAQAPDVRLPRYLTLDGETKMIAAWARDPRCIPDVDTLRRRLRLGRPLVDALSLPVRQEVLLTAWGETKRVPAWLADAWCVVDRPVLESRLNMGWHPVRALSVSADPNQIEAFGEVKAVGDWAKDARCVISDELPCFFPGFLPSLWPSSTLSWIDLRVSDRPSCLGSTFVSQIDLAPSGMLFPWFFALTLALLNV